MLFLPPKRYDRARIYADVTGKSVEQIEDWLAEVDRELANTNESDIDLEELVIQYAEQAGISVDELLEHCLRLRKGLEQRFTTVSPTNLHESSAN